MKTAPAPHKNGSIHVALVESHIKALCDARSWGLREFAGECLVRGICSMETARLLYNGEVNVRVMTVAAVARYVFDVDLDKVISLIKDKKK